MTIRRQVQAYYSATLPQTSNAAHRSSTSVPGPLPELVSTTSLPVAPPMATAAASITEAQTEPYSVHRPDDPHKGRVVASSSGAPQLIRISAAADSDGDEPHRDCVENRLHKILSVTLPASLTLKVPALRQ
jgi:hypothetical protein